VSLILSIPFLFPLMAAADATLIRRARRRCGWRVVSVPAVGGPCDWWVPKHRSAHEPEASFKAPNWSARRKDPQLPATDHRQRTVGGARPISVRIPPLAISETGMN